MSKYLTTIAGIVTTITSLALPVAAQTQSSLKVVYPPDNHQTTSAQIFLIGTADGAGELLINEKTIKRSRSGYFAPSLPLKMGENIFQLKQGDKILQLKVTRIASLPELSTEVPFAKDSLYPSQDISRLMGELVCFSAIALPNTNVSVTIDGQTFSLSPSSANAILPANNAVLNSANAPTTIKNTKYERCTPFPAIKDLGVPKFQFNVAGKTIEQQASGKIKIIPNNPVEVIQVTADAGVTRTGPSSDYSRLTPLPKGTIASVTGKEGEWLRLDYGAWIKQSETQTIPTNVPPKSLIRSITSKQVSGATEIIFPLEIPVPISVQQKERLFSLTLYNITAQTDTIRLNDDPLIKRLDWQQVKPTQIRYDFVLKKEQQWGYDLRYEGTSLILSLRHQPKQTGANKSLDGITILLDPGHGGQEFGSTGPSGYREKDANLFVSQQLEQELKKRGATVYLTRETDKDLSLGDRVKKIDEIKPTLALSLHYNALPDGGDAMNTKGISAFWFHPQAQSLAVFLEDYLTKKLNRPSYGVFWNNLALTRPHTSPSILLELGFMVNPEEFEWITSSNAQKKVATAIADGLVEWLKIVGKQ